MKKLSKDHIIDGQVYSAGTQYKIQEVQEVQEWSDNWPDLSHNEWESITVDQLEQYLDSNDVNARGDYEGTPLMLASAFNSNPKVIQLLLDRGADVDAQNRGGDTSLVLTVKHGSTRYNQYDIRDILQHLIAAGADVNKELKDGITPLMIASKYAPKVIQFFIDNGADVNAKDRKGRTALTWATLTNQNRAVIQLLVDNGARE